TCTTPRAASCRLAACAFARSRNPVGPTRTAPAASAVEACCTSPAFRPAPARPSRTPAPQRRMSGRWRIPPSASPAGPPPSPASPRWGRAVLLIHTGNSVQATEGCILVGRRHGYEMNPPWLYDSRAALEQLRGLLGIGRHTLTLRPIAATGELAA